MSNILRTVKTPNQACNEILNSGTVVLVAPLIDCANLPIVHTITVGAAGVAVDEESVAMTTDIVGGTRLRQGTVLYFGSDTLVVTADVLVDNTTATPVPIEPATAAIAAGSLARTWALQKILSPTNVPLNIEATTVDRTDLESFQGSMVKTLNNFKPQISSIASLKDRALYDVVFEGANSTVDVFAHIVYSSTQSAIGRALVSGFNSDGQQAEIQRPQFTLEFQGKDYTVTKPWIYESPELQAAINEDMKLSGLMLYS